MDIVENLIDHGEIDSQFFRNVLEKTGTADWYLESGHARGRIGSRIISHSFLPGLKEVAGVHALRLKKGACWDLFGDSIRDHASDIVTKHYGPCVVAQLQIASLPAGKKIPGHTDVGILPRLHRLHIPLITNPSVIFTINNARYLLEENHLYELNNQRPHSVSNQSDDQRFHVILDVLTQSQNLQTLWLES